jgi:hypothetical protein
VDDLISTNLHFMCEDDPFFEDESSGKNYRFFRPEGPIDFFRAHSKSANSDPALNLEDKEPSDAILAVVKKMKALVGEYTATAERVGTDLGAHLLSKVLDALQRESTGEHKPLEIIEGENATEQFLSESLYNELLEVPVVVRLSGSCNCASFPNSKDWKICLKLLADSLPESTKFNSYAN